MHKPLHIVAPDIHAGDAVGNHCIYLARELTAAGVPTTLFAQRSSSNDVTILPIEQLWERHDAEHHLLVSYSIVDPYLEQLLALPGKKIAYFHGVTPPELLREYEPVTADLCERSYAQFPLLAHFDQLHFNSAYNREQLRSICDVRESRVIPPISRHFPLFARSRSKHHSEEGGFNLLVVGRVVPHKRIDDAIRLVALLREQGCLAQLNIVGSSSNAVYSDFLSGLVASLGLEGQVHFAGMVDDATLADHFDRASVLLSTSEHEGFCVPVLEAMHLGIPVVLRRGTAAEEVGGDAVMPYGKLEEAQQHLSRLFEDGQLRDQLVEGGKIRAKELLSLASTDIWLACLDRL